MKIHKIIFSILAVLFLVLVALALLVLKDNPAPFEHIPLATGTADPLLAQARPSFEADSPAGQLLAQALEQAWSCQTVGEATQDHHEASQTVSFRSLDASAFLSGAEEEVRQLLQPKLDEAIRAVQVRAEDGLFHSELVDEAYCQVLGERLNHLADYTVSGSAELALHYEDERWTPVGDLPLPALPERSPDELAAEAEEALRQALGPVELHFTLPADCVTPGPVPEEDNYLVTNDPAEIEALLATPEARALIGDAQTVWQPDLPFLDTDPIRAYLDETILVIEWNEIEARTVGTFSEVFVADGSQLRRRIAGDSYGSNALRTTSGFAQECNAVLASGGDFYWHPQRFSGIVVFDREIYRFSPNNADTCFITASGDMLFGYRGTFKTQDEAKQFVEENDVLFSLVFGPVLIDGGEDKTPGWYPWGEISEEYARSALGMVGERHYLVGNLNCRNDHFYLATLQSMTDAMLKRGCVKAYALDGGQTATTVFHGELVNPVQFGWEKEISDIIYFATALPEDPAAAPAGELAEAPAP